MASTNPGAIPANTGGTGAVPTGKIPAYSEIAFNSGVIPVHSFQMNQDVTVASVTKNFSHQITEKLNDKNFLLWRQQVEPAISWSQSFRGQSSNSSSLPFRCRP